MSSDAVETVSILYEACLYFSPHLLVIIMVWFWGVNLKVFGKYNVDYQRTFNLPADHLSHHEIWMCAGGMTIIFAVIMGAYVLFSASGHLLFAALLPMFVYPAFETVFLCYRGILYDLLWRLGRIIFPRQEVTFADTLLADILTSLAKVFSDYTCSVFRMARSEVAKKAWYEDDYVCGGYFIPMPVALTIPYWFRLAQCVQRWKHTSNWINIWNAIKFGSSIAVIMSSALQHYFHDPTWAFIIWIVSSFMNSAYLFAWDMRQDWNIRNRFNCQILNPNQQRPLLKWVFYVWIFGSDLVLRLTWTYKFFDTLRYNSFVIFGVANLEILRRCQWVYFRVENEERNNLEDDGLQAPLLGVPHRPQREDEEEQMNEGLQAPVLDDGLQAPLLGSHHGAQREDEEAQMNEGLQAPVLDDGLQAPLLGNHHGAQREDEEAPMDEGLQAPVLDDGLQAPLLGGHHGAQREDEEAQMDQQGVLDDKPVEMDQ